VLKKHIPKCLILIIALSFLSFYLLKSEQAGSYITYVYVSPKEQVIDFLNESFIVNVSICNVLDLYGYEFKLFYNSSILNGSQVIEGPFLNSTGKSAFFWVVAFNDHYNSTHGIVWVDSCLTGDVLGVNGNGTLVTIKFKSLAVGSSQLSLDDVKLVDSRKNSIPCQNIDGSVTIIPELTLPFITLALCLLLYILQKRYRHHKANQIKKDSFTEIRQINDAALMYGGRS